MPIYWDAFPCAGRAGMQDPEWAPRTLWWRLRTFNLRQQSNVGCDWEESRAGHRGPPAIDLIFHSFGSFSWASLFWCCRQNNAASSCSQDSPDEQIRLMKLKWKRGKLKLICSVLFVLHARLLPVLVGLIKSCTSLYSTNDFYTDYTAHMLHISTAHTYCSAT